MLLNKKIVLFLILISLTFSCTKENLKNSDDLFTCNYYGTLNSFSPNKIINSQNNNSNIESDTEKAVSSILTEVGLIKNFIVLENSEVNNAAAVVINSKRLIIYNKDFMNSANKISNNPWSSISILAHEIGHHLQGHTLNNEGSRPQIELEADKFSGFVLAKMGASLEDAQSAILNLVSDNGSDTHPAKSDRLKAIALGFEEGKSSKNKVDIKEISTDKTSLSNFYNLSKNSKIDYVLQNKIGSDWKLEILGDFIDNKYDLEIINNVRKTDNNFPFTAFGDFDNDGSQDIALKVVKNGISKLVIYNPQIDKIFWWSKDVKGSVIKRVNSSELEAYDGTQAHNLQADGIMVEYLESSLYYIFWNGNQYSEISIAD